MTYDFHGGWESKTGHNAPLYKNNDEIISDIAPSYMKSIFNCDAAIQTYVRAGVSSQNILMGLPLYGRGWQAVTSNALNDFSQAASSTPPTGTWKAGVFDYDDLKKSYIPSYDDVTSISVKSDYVKQKHLGGTFFWELSSDRQGELVSTAYNVFSNTAETIVSSTTARSKTVTTTGSLLSMTTTLISSVIAQKTVRTWQSYYVYSMADEVTHDGRKYNCRQAHTSLLDWMPNCVPALWLQIQS
ncbi:unnamed protein product [Rotaria magnacalcarata]|uniref:GH18 domain-containing protein n=1 Tax=Rotaria magnacalcarata TaxID=392030 RepID=A0A816Z244_9BILA|nr:unnamed protein product [Rotaria magnacalcarata]CAF4045044.1 unnamed protein product [Rotaria magnacalcarata]